MVNNASPYAGKKVLVTGGLGFIGSNLAIALVQQGAQVTIVDAAVAGTGWNEWNIAPVRGEVDVVKCTIADTQVQDLLPNTEVIFNLAGVLSHIDALQDPLHDLQLNTVDQVALLEMCRKRCPAARIVFTGTRNQYGRAQYLPVDELHPQVPIDTNGISEIAAELYHFLYTKLYGMETTSIRLCNVFGPRHQMRHSRQGVLNWFLRLLLDGQPITLMGTGEQKREAIYVDDVVDALLRLGVAENVVGEAFNIGAFPISLKEFCETAIDVLGEGSIQYVPFTADRAKIEPGDYVAGTTKLRTKLSWAPKTDLRQALEGTLRYYKENKAQYW